MTFSWRCVSGPAITVATVPHLRTNLKRMILRIRAIFLLNCDVGQMIIRVEEARFIKTYVVPLCVTDMFGPAVCYLSQH